MVKNLSQFKKAMAEGKRFLIVEHFVHEDYTGQIRVPNVVHTNAVYMKCENEHPFKDKVNSSNDDKGIFLQYETAKHWDFSTENIVYYNIWKNGSITMKSKVMVI